MADSIKGGATLKNVVEAMGGKLDKSKSVTSADLQSALDKGTYNKNIDKTELSKGFLGKDNYLKDDARELIIRQYKLQAGDTFKYDGVEYIVKDGFDKWTGQPRAVRRSLGGPVVAGQTYAVNDRLTPLGYQQEGFTPFTPQMSGIIRPNADTMPKYNIASGQVTGMRGGINSSSSNNNYSINIALNGTNVTADDVVRRFKQEMALVNAKEGRSKTVGGSI